VALFCIVLERRNVPARGIVEPEGSAILYRNVFAAVDAAPTAPAKTMACAKTMHLLTGMVDSAAVTKKRLGHGGLGVIWFSVSAEWLAKVAGR
jgi:hypothetical protein